MRTSLQPLNPESQAILRELLAGRSALRLAELLGVEHGAVARAAAGARLLAGTRRLILDGLDRLRASGELRSAS